MTVNRLHEYFVKHGSMILQEQVVKGSRMVMIVCMGAGDVFGEITLLSGESRRSTVRTATETRVFEIFKDDPSPLLEVFSE